MTDRELQRLSRQDLMQILYEQSKEIGELQDQVDVLEDALQDKELKIEQAGSIAEAALELNGVFEAAENACRQYVDNIKRRSRQGQDTTQDGQESGEAAAIVEEARKRAAKLEQDTKIRCDRMIADAKAQSQEYWDRVFDKLDRYMSEHEELEDAMNLAMDQAEAELYGEAAD